MSTDKYTSAFSDRGFFVKSKKLATPADDTYNLIRVPKWSFVDAVWLQILTAFSTEFCTMSVGWMGNGETAVLNGFMSSEVAEGHKVGLKKAAKDTLVTFEGKYFSTAGGAITCTTDDNGGTAGTFYVFAHYWVIQ